MLKEIYEQPQAIRDTFRGRMRENKGVIKMAGVDDHIDKFINAKRLVILACGTSWHAGLVAEYIIEELMREAHAVKEHPVANWLFFAGFLALVLLEMHITS